MFTQKIKVRYFNSEPIKAIEKGDWIDLTSSTSEKVYGPTVETKTFENADAMPINVVHFNTCTLPLGIAMQLPAGYEAVIVARSSTFKHFHIMATNAMGVIDNSYRGDEDEWKFQCIAFEDGFVNAGDRICQFKIQLSQKATVWQKIKWIFTSKFEFIKVPLFDCESRGGFGTTGK